MISFGITPFTDLPAHRIIRYFTRESSDKEEQVAVYSGLSHLWSEKRRREEDRFATLMADLVAIAKELDVVVSGTSTSDAAFMSGAHDSGRNSTQNAKNEDECSGLNLMYRRSLDTSTAHVHTTGTCMSPCADYYEYAEETQDDAVWLNDMKAKVETLLQDAHDVLGAPSIVASNTSESLFDLNPSDKHNDEICHSLSLDVISLYMHDSSFTSEGPTLLEGDQDSSMVTSKSDGDWLLSDTSTDTANTSFSLDQYLEIESNLKDRDDAGFREKAIINILVEEQTQTWIQET